MQCIKFHETISNLCVSTYINQQWAFIFIEKRIISTQKYSWKKEPFDCATVQLAYDLLVHENVSSGILNYLSHFLLENELFFVVCVCAVIRSDCPLFSAENAMIDGE